MISQENHASDCFTRLCYNLLYMFFNGFKTGYKKNLQNEKHANRIIKALNAAFNAPEIS